jgi:hypothetical protein
VSYEDPVPRILVALVALLVVLFVSSLAALAIRDRLYESRAM